MVFRAAHAAGLLRWRVKDRKTHFLTDHVIAPHQFLDLFLRHVQLFASLEVDGVDDAVGVDVLAVYMGADQHLAAVEVFRQPPRGFVGLPWIDSRAFWKALHHVVEQHTVGFMMQPLGGHEVRVDRFRLAVDACDQLLTVTLCFLVLHGVPHHGSHASGALTTLVVSEADDRHFSPPLSFQNQPDSGAEFRECLAYAVQIDYRDASHMCQGDELIQISAD